MGLLAGCKITYICITTLFHYLNLLVYSLSCGWQKDYMLSNATILLFVSRCSACFVLFRW